MKNEFISVNEPVLDNYSTLAELEYSTASKRGNAFLKRCWLIKRASEYGLVVFEYENEWNFCIINLLRVRTSMNGSLIIDCAIPKCSINTDVSFTTVDKRSEIHEKSNHKIFNILRPTTTSILNRLNIIKVKYSYFYNELMKVIKINNDGE